MFSVFILSCLSEDVLSEKTGGLERIATPTEIECVCDFCFMYKKCYKIN